MAIDYRSEITLAIIKKLDRSYPKAVRYCDLFDDALNGTSASKAINKRGGRYMQTLITAGRAKRIADGYYVAVPQPRN